MTDEAQTSWFDFLEALAKQGLLQGALTYMGHHFLRPLEESLVANHQILEFQTVSTPRGEVNRCTANL